MRAMLRALGHGDHGHSPEAGDVAAVQRLHEPVIWVARNTSQVADRDAVEDRPDLVEAGVVGADALAPVEAVERRSAKSQHRDEHEEASSRPAWSDERAVAPRERSTARCRTPRAAPAGRPSLNAVPDGPLAGGPAARARCAAVTGLGVCSWSTVTAVRALLPIANGCPASLRSRLVARPTCPCARQLISITSASRTYWSQDTSSRRGAFALPICALHPRDPDRAFG